MTPPRVRRTAEEARRVILDAAEKRLREGGPEALRLQEIARDVGVSHPAILHHFQSRAGLTHALAERAMTRLEEDLREALSGSEGDGASILERVFGVAHLPRPLPRSSSSGRRSNGRISVRTT